MFSSCLICPEVSLIIDDISAISNVGTSWKICGKRKIPFDDFYKARQTDTRGLFTLLFTLSQHCNYCNRKWTEPHTDGNNLKVILWKSPWGGILIQEIDQANNSITLYSTVFLNLWICIVFPAVCVWGSGLAPEGHRLQPELAGALPRLQQPPWPLRCA